MRPDVHKKVALNNISENQFYRKYLNASYQGIARSAVHEGSLL